MKNIENNKILRPHIIICEGIDDQMFLFWLLKREEFMGDGGCPFFQILTTDGKGNLKNKLHAMQKQEGFYDQVNKIKSITVIFDADNDIEKSIKNIKKSFKEVNLASPTSPGIKTLDPKCEFPDIATGFLLFPQLNVEPKNGDLETLCLELFSSPEAGSIKNYIEEGIRQFGSETFKTPNKNKLHGCLSFTDEYAGKTLGHAAKLGAFDANSFLFSYMKEFLNKMVE